MVYVESVSTNVISHSAFASILLSNSLYYLAPATAGKVLCLVACVFCDDVCNFVTVFAC